MSTLDNNINSDRHDKGNFFDILISSVIYISILLIAFAYYYKKSTLRNINDQRRDYGIFFGLSIKSVIYISILLIVFAYFYKKLTT